MRNEVMAQGATLAVAAMLVSGLLSAMQAPTNAMLRPVAGSPVNAAFISFAVGTIALALAAALLRVRPDLGAAASLPWYAWLGGVYGAGFVAAAAYSAPRIGVAPTLTLLIAGQAVGALAIDHLGAFGVVRHAVSPLRLAGMALVIGGVVLVRRG